MTLFTYRRLSLRIGVKWSLFVAAGLLLTCGPDVRGQIIAAESFDYVAGNPLSGQSGGTGWSGGWSGTESFHGVAAGSLSDPSGTLVTSGNSVTASIGTASRSLAASLGADGTTRYLSFLVRRNPNPSTTDVGSITLGGTTSLNFRNIGDRWGIEWVTGPPSFTSLAANSTVPVTNASALLVGRIDFAAGNDTIRLYVNPTPGATEPAAASAMLTVPDVGTLSSISFFASGNTYAFDEIRLGSTFASVTPVPEPSGLLLLGCAGLGAYMTAVRQRMTRRGAVSSRCDGPQSLAGDQTSGSQ